MTAYADVASEVLFAISGRQFKGLNTRTVVASVGRSGNGTTAKASLGSWWPVTAVTDVIGLPQRGSPIELTTDDWSWSGGIGLTVPARFARGQVQATLTYGQAPPASGVLAAKALAAELALGDPNYDGESTPRLPQLTTSVSRQGVSQSFVTILDVIKEGATGVHEVDQFVATYNSIKTKSRPRVRKIR